MPIGELVGEGLGALIRGIGRLLFELVFELFLAGTGRLLIRIASPKSEPGDLTCTLVGLLFWVVLGVGGYSLYRLAAG